VGLCCTTRTINTCIGAVVTFGLGASLLCPRIFGSKMNSDVGGCSDGLPPTSPNPLWCRCRYSASAPFFCSVQGESILKGLRGVTLVTPISRHLDKFLLNCVLGGGSLLIFQWFLLYLTLISNYSLDIILAFVDDAYNINVG
jgi:hypothetical protein